MFNIDAQPTFTRTVTALVPQGEGVDPQSFKATFNVLDDEEIEGIPLGDVEKVKELLRKMVIGLDELVDTAGNAVPFSEQVLELVLKKSYVRLALIKAYYSGADEGRTGN